MTFTELKNKYQGLLQFILYGFVGGIAFLFDFGGLMFLYKVFGINHLISAVFGFLLGTWVNYILSKLLVFKVQYKSKATELILHYLISAGGLCLTIFFQWSFVDLLELPVSLSKIITTMLVFFWNFFARKLFMYSGHNRLMKGETK